MNMAESSAIDQWRQEFAESLRPILSKVEEAIKYKKGGQTSRIYREQFSTIRVRPASARGPPLFVSSLKKDPDNVGDLRDTKSRTVPNLGRSKKPSEATPLLSRRKGSTRSPPPILAAPKRCLIF